MKEKSSFTNSRQLLMLAGALAALLMAGCASGDSVLEMPKEQGYRIGSVSAQEHATARGWISGGSKHYWDPNAPSGGSDKIIINLPEQKAFYYRNGALVGATIVSTGREGYRTPSGTYKLLSKHKEHRSTLYGGYVDIETGKVLKDDVDTRKDPMPPGSKYMGAEMPYFLRLRHTTKGITSIGMHAGYLPGYPASHGCIRLPRPAAQRFFDESNIGMTVLIENAQPDTSSPPATAPMMGPVTVAAAPGPDQPAYAPNSRRARRAASLDKKRKLRQYGSALEVPESRPASSGNSVSVVDGTSYLVQ